jgi:hypothetical protein
MKEKDEIKPICLSDFSPTRIRVRLLRKLGQHSLRCTSQRVIVIEGNGFAHLTGKSPIRLSTGFVSGSIPKKFVAAVNA